MGATYQNIKSKSITREEVSNLMACTFSKSWSESYKIEKVEKCSKKKKIHLNSKIKMMIRI